MLDAADVERGDRVAVVNEAAAALWPAGQDPVGRQLRLDLLGQPAPRDRIDVSRGTDVTIVGSRSTSAATPTSWACGWPATRLLPNQLFGIRATDPIAYLAVLAVLGAITFLACYLPARRAMRIDAVAAIRQS